MRLGFWRTTWVLAYNLGFGIQLGFWRTTYNSEHSYPPNRDFPQLQPLMVFNYFLDHFLRVIGSLIFADEGLAFIRLWALTLTGFLFHGTHVVLINHLRIFCFDCERERSWEDTHKWWRDLDDPKHNWSPQWKFSYEILMRSHEKNFEFFIRFSVDHEISWEFLTRSHEISSESHYDWEILSGFPFHILASSHSLSNGRWPIPINVLNRWGKVQQG